VDDEPLEREVLASMIRKNNLDISHIFEAQNGADAVQVAIQQQIDVVIMDIKMPVMDGITATEIIKREVTDCRVLFLTAYDEFDFAIRSIKLKADDYLLKPAHPDDIRQALVKFVPAAKTEGTPSAQALHRHPDIEKIVRYIDQNLHANISLESLSGNVHLHPQYLCRLFKQQTGCTITQYMTDQRLKKAKSMLEHAQESIAEISNQCGFSDANYFARVFKKREGISPTQYQQQVIRSKKQRGTVIQ
jgi:YesN/AraC family two-component response regulator